MISMEHKMFRSTSLQVVIILNTNSLTYLFTYFRLRFYFMCIFELFNFQSGTVKM
jgi:hypothetical protein